MTANPKAIPVVYRTPLTERDRDRILADEVRLYVTVRRHPPQLNFVLVSRGRNFWTTDWDIRSIPLMLEPPAT